MNAEEAAEMLALALSGDLGVELHRVGWTFREMDGLSELYARTNAGEVFRFTCEAVGDDEFDPFEEDA